MSVSCQTGRMAHVLILDSEPARGFELAAILAQAGHLSGVAGNVAEALQLLCRQRPDLLLLDHGLPLKETEALLRALHLADEFCAMPIVGIGTMANQTFRFARIYEDLAIPVRPCDLLDCVARLTAPTELRRARHRGGEC